MYIDVKLKKEKKKKEKSPVYASKNIVSDTCSLIISLLLSPILREKPIHLRGGVAAWVGGTVPPGVLQNKLPQCR